MGTENTAMQPETVVLLDNHNPLESDNTRGNVEEIIYNPDATGEDSSELSAENARLRQELSEANAKLIEKEKERVAYIINTLEAIRDDIGICKPILLKASKETKKRNLTSQLSNLRLKAWSLATAVGRIEGISSEDDRFGKLLEDLNTLVRSAKNDGEIEIGKWGRPINLVLTQSLKADAERIVEIEQLVYNLLDKYQEM